MSLDFHLHHLSHYSKYYKLPRQLIGTILLFARVFRPKHRHCTPRYLASRHDTKGKNWAPIVITSLVALFFSSFLFFSLSPLLDPKARFFFPWLCCWTSVCELGVSEKKGYTCSDKIRFERPKSSGHRQKWIMIREREIMDSIFSVIRASVCSQRSNVGPQLSRRAQMLTVNFSLDFFDLFWFFPYISQTFNITDTGVSHKTFPSSSSLWIFFKIFKAKHLITLILESQNLSLVKFMDFFFFFFKRNI